MWTKKLCEKTSVQPGKGLSIANASCQLLNQPQTPTGPGGVPVISGEGTLSALALGERGWGLRSDIFSWGCTSLEGVRHLSVSHALGRASSYSRTTGQPKRTCFNCWRRISERKRRWQGRDGGCAAGLQLLSEVRRRVRDFLGLSLSHCCTGMDLPGPGSAEWGAAEGRASRMRVW